MGEQKKSLRDICFEADDIKREIVHLPEWGMKIEARTISAEDYAWLTVIANESGRTDYRSLFPDIVVAGSYVPGDGDEKVFKPEDAEKLKKKSNAPMKRLADAILRLSGMSAEGVDELKKD